MMNSYLCAECSTELSKWEMFLNKKYGLGKLYCEWCNTKKEREAINSLVESEKSMTNDYTRELTATPTLIDTRDNIKEDLDEVG